MTVDELYERIDENSLRLIAIDGRCGSGKTTLAEWLRQKSGGIVVHMDDFYLQPWQRTPERYATPGENVDHERFLEEVLKPIKEKKFFSYHAYDAHAMRMKEEAIAVDFRKLVIVEGSYSLHPDLRPYYQLKIFLDIDPKLQYTRLRKRDLYKLDDFLTKWIPLEEAYFNSMNIREVADVILHAEDIRPSIR